MAVLLSAMLAAQSMTCYAAGAGDDIAVSSAQSLGISAFASASTCLLYTSDAADEL